MAVAFNEVMERKYYTGLADMQVVAINPSQKELEALGFKVQNEPEYVTETEEDGVKITKTRIDIQLRHPNIPSLRPKLTIFVEDRKQTSKDGTKHQYINDLGRSCMSATPDTYHWFDSSTARHAYRGEVQLHEFLAAWAAVTFGKEVKLESMDKIVKGDVSELKTLLTKIPNNKLKVLLGVRLSGDNKYQEVYNKYFDKSGNRRIDYWEKFLANEYNQFKSDYQNSLNFKEYTGESVTADEEVTAVSADSDPF